MKRTSALLIIFVLFSHLFIQGCVAQGNSSYSAKTPIPYYLGVTEKHSADYVLTEEQKDVAKKFIASVYKGDYKEYCSWFMEIHANYIKNQFWQDVHSGKVIQQDSFWFVATSADTMTFVYANPETVYDMVYFNKINGAWKIESSEIKAD